MKAFNNRRSWLTILIFVCTAIVLLLLFPRQEQVSLHYEVNRAWTNPTELAKFDLPIYLSPEEQQAALDSLNEVFEPIYRKDDAALATVQNIISTAAELSDAEKVFLNERFVQVYRDGVIDEATSQRLAKQKRQTLKLGTFAENHDVQATSMRTTMKAYARVDSIVRRYHPELRDFLSAKLSGNVKPNIVVNEDLTKEFRDKQEQRIRAAVRVIQKDEKIIGYGDRVTPQLYAALQSYYDELAERTAGETRSGIVTLLGQILFVALLLGAVYFYLRLYRPEILESYQRTSCLLLLFAGFYAFTVFMVANFDVDGLYIVPFAILPILLIVFYDMTTAMFIAWMEILMSSTLAMTAFPVEFVFIESVAILTAIYSLRELSRRSQLLRTAAYVFGVYVVAYTAVELVQLSNLSSFSWKLIGFFAVNMVLCSFAYILIFVIEKIFGFISVVTLVELSDINNPLLRELSEECPGTFQHSMAVANLVTNAAHRVGANVQLVRAGALYHDIGKSKNPAFFTENQHGVNPHDSLTPVQSARVIIGHVTDGLKMAEKAKLPKVIRDMIEQHHGSSTTRYFYNTYCNAHPGENVDPAPFTYPGENPQSKEASLLMMADVVEAASRSLTDHKPETITALVDKLIDAQVAEGYHKDSPLSFRDITTIKQSFVESLRTMYHVRIAYPDKK